MADNVTTQTTLSSPPDQTKFATRSVTYSGDAAAVLPAGCPVFVAGADDAKTATDASANAGTADAGTQRVIEASDGPVPTALGAKADTSATSDTGTFSLIALFKRLLEKLTAGITVSGTVTASGPLTDTQLRATAVPVSAASLPLPSGAATAAKQPALGTAGTPSADVISIQGVASMTAVKVDGSAVTQPVSAASLPLPSGAATSALQGGGLPAALGAGGGLKVDGSGTALPVSGTVTAIVTPLTGVSSTTDISLASSATSAQLIAANANRKGMYLTNTDANDVYIYFGITATTSKFTVVIPAGFTWEMPLPVYTGRIDAIWAADGSGSLIGSEL